MKAAVFQGTGWYVFPMKIPAIAKAKSDPPSALEVAIRKALGASRRSAWVRRQARNMFPIIIRRSVMPVKPRSATVPK